MIIKMLSSGSVLFLFFMISYRVTKLVCEKTVLMKTPKRIKEGTWDRRMNLLVYINYYLYSHIETHGIISAMPINGNKIDIH